jgi:hypothetical protein
MVIGKRRGRLKTICDGGCRGREKCRDVGSGRHDGQSTNIERRDTKASEGGGTDATTGLHSAFSGCRYVPPLHAHHPGKRCRGPWWSMRLTARVTLSPLEESARSQ